MSTVESVWPVGYTKKDIQRPEKTAVMKVTGRKTNVLFSTMGQKMVVLADSLTGLQVSGVGGSDFPLLPVVLMQSKMLVTFVNDTWVTGHTNKGICILCNCRQKISLKGLWPSSVWSMQVRFMGLLCKLLWHIFGYFLFLCFELVCHSAITSLGPVCSSKNVVAFYLSRWHRC